MNQAIIEKLNAYIDANKENIIADLAAISSVKSVADETSPIKPYGQDCKNVLDAMLKKGEEENFKTHNYEYYVGSVKYDVGAKDDIGILAHLDVVPAGDDWTVTEPYTPLLKDGYLFGRGCSDDKSGAIGGLYIMKAFREFSVDLKHNINLMLGTNEETGMADMHYFTAHYESPLFTFVPDGGFPGVGGEFGRIRFSLTSNNALSDDFKDMHAGSAFNIVPNKAFCTLKKDTTIDYKALPAESFDITETEDGIEIMAKGVTTHAAGPERGLNAVLVLTENLAKLPGIKEEDKKILTFLTNVNKDYYGSFLGMDKEDEYGKTVSSGTILEFNSGKVSLLNDCRRAPTDNNDRLTANIDAKCEEWGFTATYQEKTDGYLLDINGPVIQAIKKVYQEETGDTESEISVGKGGTYAGALPRAFATGITLWNKDHRPDYLPEGHGSAHQPDEFLCIEDFLAGIKLLMKTILTVDEIL